MGRSAWTLLLLLMSAIVCISAIPRADRPDTAYNEVDTPVNQALPVLQGIRLVRPVKIPTILDKQAWEVRYGANIQERGQTAAPPPLWRGPRLLQSLLCTLLI